MLFGEIREVKGCLSVHSDMAAADSIVLFCRIRLKRTIVSLRNCSLVRLMCSCQWQTGLTALLLCENPPNAAAHLFASFFRILQRETHTGRGYELRQNDAIECDGCTDSDLSGFSECQRTEKISQ